MDWNSQHVGYVMAAYTSVAVVLGAVVLHTLWRAKSLKAQLRKLNLNDTGQKEI
jgi:heme exporter protein CcmD